MEPRRERHPQDKQLTASKATYVYLLLGFLFLLTGFISADHLLSYGRIHKGVSVSGINVGGMTPAQARQKLYTESASILDRPLLVLHENKSWKISPRDLNATLNVEGAVDTAYNLGRRGTVLKQLKERFSLWQRPRELQLHFSLNDKKLQEFVAEIKAGVETKPREARIVVRKGQVSILSSREGLEVREGELLALLTEKLSNPKNRRIVLPVTHLPVHTATQEAEATLQETRKMLEGPLALKFHQYKWVLQPQEIGALLEFREEKQRVEGSRFVSRLQPRLDRKLTEGLLRTLTKDISILAKDAQFGVAEDKVNIVPSEDGFEVDCQASIPLMEEALLTDSPRQTSIVMSKTRPKRTTEVATSMGIKEKVSTFTTRFDPRALSRVHNIRLLAGALDGALVAPGEVFSFNGTIGPRTAAKGYQEAPTIINGELVPTLGGGICQVGTTFFNSVFFAGLEIVERHNHSFYISKYPAGRDATVSWGGADLQFRNDTPNHLLIKTASTPSSLTITLYGTNPHREVTFTTAPFTDFMPFTSKYVPDPSLPKDQQKVEENGVTGRHITVVRTVKQDGKTIHKDKLVSHYKPKKAIVKVGTGEAAAQLPVVAGEQASPPTEGAPPPSPQPAAESSPQQGSPQGGQGEQ